ncbi:hypothetical protein [Salinisphaera aquimarina]|uniref:hypothetical protein n=1 Tax=Salinisphaera aquimarina TaxID=2094031 RepID=UPI0036D4396B
MLMPLLSYRKSMKYSVSLKLPTDQSNEALQLTTQIAAALWVSSAAFGCSGGN